jgi:hypothetical protein
MATEVPREKLKELIEKNGDSLIQDRDRCEGLLKDYCGGHRREISALVGALEERIPVELKSSWQTAMTPEAMRARLVQRLEDNRGLAPDVAGYAVDTWSYALGVGLGRSSERVVDLPALNGVAVGSTVPVIPPVVVKAGMSNQNKAVVGGVGLLAAAAVAFVLLRHPQPSAPPNKNVPAVQNGQNQNEQPGQNTVPSVQAGPNAVNPVVDSGNSTGDQRPKSSSMMAAGSSVMVRFDKDFNSDDSAVGELLPATVVTPLTSDGNVVVQRGAKAQLKVVRIDNSGKISGKSEVEFALVRLTAHGKLVRIHGSSRAVDGPSQGVRTAERTGIGGTAGAAFGAITGHLFHHAGAGAAAGAGSGGAAGALTSRPAPVKISAETVLQFRLPRGIPTGS